MPPRRKSVKSVAQVLPARPGDITEVVIERIVPGGLGLGYGGGRTLFVSKAAAGDVLKVRVDRDQGRVAHASIVEVAMEDWTPSPYPVVVADPAREGLGRGACDVLAATGAERFVLVSFDAASLGRDAPLLTQAGYRHVRSTVIDLFVNTAHVEVVTEFRLG